MNLIHLLSWVILGFVLLIPARELADPSGSQVVKDQNTDSLPEGAIRRLGSARFRLSYTGIRFTPDGKYFVANRNRSLVYIDPESGDEVKRVVQAPYQVQNWAISDDGKLALIYGYANRNMPESFSGNGPLPWFKLDLWDLTNGSLLRPMNWHADDSLQFAQSQFAYFSPDGKSVATNHGFPDPSIIMWDVTTGEQVWKKPGSTRGFIDQGQQLLVCSSDRQKGKVSILDAKTGKEIRSFDVPADLGWDKKLSPDGRTIYFASTRGEAGNYLVRSWDIASGQEAKPLVGHQLWGTRVAATADGNYVATSGRDQTVRIWDRKSSQCLHVIDTKPLDCISLAFHSDSKSLWVMASTLPHRYDIVSGKLLSPSNVGHESAITMLAYSSDGRILWTNGNDRTLRSWEVATGRELSKRRDSGLYMVNKSAVSNDNKTIAFHGAEKTGLNAIRPKLEIQELQTGQVKNTYLPKGLAYGELCFSPKDDQLALMCGEAGTTILSAQAGQEICHLKEAQGSNCWTVDGNHLISTSRSREPGHVNDCTLAVWNSRTGQLERILDHEQYLGIACSPDGRTLAFTRRGKAIQLVEFATGQERLRVSDLPTNGSWMIKFSPDGRWLAAVIDREIWVWDAYTGEKVTIFPGHENGVQTLTFSPNSKTIASGGSDGTVLIWDLSSHVHEPSARPPVTAQKSWADLKNSDAKVAYQAMHMLTINPEATCKLAQGLRADPGMPPEELTQCIRDLDNSQFSARDKATKRLEEAREQALPALRKLLEQQPSLELERRAKKIIDSISSNQLPAEASLHLRAIEVLERVGSSSARSVLEKIAEGNPLSQRTVEAKAALDRLNTSERK